MTQWKYTDASCAVAARTFEDGSSQSCLASTLPEGTVILPADPPARDISAEIAELERSNLMPRATREFMLSFMEASFAPEQLSANAGYQKVKAFDQQIRALRALL